MNKFRYISATVEAGCRHRARIRKNIAAWGLALLILSSGASAAAEARSQFPTAYPPANDIVLEKHVAVPMRDGVRLYADIYRPKKTGKYPVIVGRTPYGVDRTASPLHQYPHAYEAPIFFATRGYVFVYQDARGREESEGLWHPFRYDINDGYDTIEWAAAQPWSNGKVGMHGMSGQGTIQWHAAASAPPHLVTIVPSVASTSFYHDWVTSNGAWRLQFNLTWGAIMMGSRVTRNLGPYIQPDGSENIRLSNIAWHLPLNRIQERTGTHSPFFDEWISLPDYGDYWQEIDIEERFDQISIPVLNFGGWFDLFRQGTLHGYSGMKSRAKTALARENTRLVMGAWGHWPARKLGELDFGDGAYVDQNALTLEWLDYWLKGVDNGVAEQKTVRVFVMGANEWRGLDDFPSPDVQYRELYFDNSGTLTWNSPSGDSAPDRYTYDPANPVMSSSISPGRDLRSLESRDDVLLYTSDALSEELDVIGPLELRLYVQTNVPDTDFVARLVDVYPDGRSYSVAEGILRARYHASTSQPRYLKSGVVYPLTIDLVGVANTFKKDHRIRVLLTSSDFPAYSRNLNTDNAFGTSEECAKADQVVYHTARYPSHIQLPVKLRRRSADDGRRTNVVTPAGLAAR